MAFYDRHAYHESRTRVMYGQMGKLTVYQLGLFSKGGASQIAPTPFSLGYGKQCVYK